MEDKIQNQTEMIENGNDRLAGILGSLTSAVNSQTVILQTMLENEVDAKRKQEALASQESVSGEKKETDTSSGGKFDFKSLIPSKKKLMNAGLVALAVPFALRFFEGFFEAIQTESGTILDILSKGVLSDTAFTTALTGSTIGLLVGGPIGAIIGGIFGLLFEGAVEYLKELTGEDSMIGKALAGLQESAAGMAAAFVLTIGALKMALSKAMSIVGDTLKSAKNKLLNLFGMGDDTPKPSDTPDDKPKKGPLTDKERERFKKLSDKQLKDAGIKEIVGKDGSVQYRNIDPDGKMGKTPLEYREVLERSDKNVLQRAMTKYPGFAKFVKLGGPVLGTAVSLATLASILDDEDLSEEEKTAAIAGEAVGVGGSLLVGAIGATVGSAVPGLGTLAGGVGGSIAGYFGGEYIGREFLAPYLLKGPEGIDKEAVESVKLVAETMEQSPQYTEPAQRGSSSFTVSETGAKMVPLPSVNMQSPDLGFGLFGSGGSTFNNVQPISNNVKQGDTVVGGSTTNIVINRDQSKALPNNVPRALVE